MPNHRRNESVELDESDRRLIEALDRNARTSTADLARLIGLSPQSTSDRIKRLEDLGVIAGFTVRLDPTMLGLGIGAYIRIRPAMGELQRVSKLVADTARSSSATASLAKIASSQKCSCRASTISSESSTDCFRSRKRTHRSYSPRRFGEDSRRCAANGTLPVRQSAPPRPSRAPRVHPPTSPCARVRRSRPASPLPSSRHRASIASATRSTNPGSSRGASYRRS